jgi:hypothetical protein
MGTGTWAMPQEPVPRLKKKMENGSHHIGFRFFVWFLRLIA